MPREKEGYRDNMEALLEYFGGKRLLSIEDVAEYCGRDRRFVKKRFGIDKNGIMLPVLARRMCD